MVPLMFTDVKSQLQKLTTLTFFMHGTRKWMMATWRKEKLIVLYISCHDVNSSPTDTMAKLCRTTPITHNSKFYKSTNMITGLVPRWYVFPSIIWHPKASNWSGRRPFSVPWQHNKFITESIILLLRSDKRIQIPWWKILFSLH